MLTGQATAQQKCIKFGGTPCIGLDCQFHDLELGTDGKFFGKTEDEYECARECRADEQCQGFLFCTEDNPAQFKDCFFKWKFGSPHIP